MARGLYGVDTKTGYPLCKRGHVRSPDNLGSRGKCKTCNRERQQAYQQSEKGRARQKAYKQSEKGRASQRKYASRYAANLSDGYVAHVLRIPSALAMPDLVEIKRLSIQLHRGLKNGNQIRTTHNDYG